MGAEQEEKNDVTETEKYNEQIGNKSVEDSLVDEENTSHPAKRRKVSLYEMVPSLSHNLCKLLINSNYCFDDGLSMVALTSANKMVFN